MKVSVAEAKNKLTQLIAAVEKGERVTICRHGHPVVDIVQTKDGTQIAPQFGMMEGRIKILDPDWDKPQNDVEAWLRGDV